MGQMTEEIKLVGQQLKRGNQNGGRSWPPSRCKQLEEMEIFNLEKMFGVP